MTVIAFRPTRSPPQRRDGDLPDGGAAILFFTGIRYERIEAEGPKRVSSLGGKTRAERKARADKKARADRKTWKAS